MTFRMFAQLDYTQYTVQDEPYAWAWQTNFRVMRKLRSRSIKASFFIDMSTLKDPIVCKTLQKAI